MLSKFAPVQRGDAKPAVVQRWEMMHWSMRLLATPNDYRTYRLYRRGVTRRQAQRFVSGVRARAVIWPLNADIEVLEDKVRFEEHFAGLPMPKTVAVIGEAPTVGAELRTQDDIVDFITQRLNAGQQLVVKMLDSMQGVGVTVAVGIDGDDLVLSNGVRQSLRGAAGAWLASGGAWLVQQRLAQHPVLSVFNDSSLNTVRFGTFYRADGSVDLEYAVLRIGRRGSQIDAFAGGGVSVPVDVRTGSLSSEGSQKAKFSVDPITAHPDSGIAFAGVTLPFWDEVCELARAFAKRTPENRYVGWDIAITPAGPVCIEGNHNWDVALPQSSGVGLLTDALVSKMRAETALTSDPRTLPRLRPLTALREFRHDHGGKI